MTLEKVMDVLSHDLSRSMLEWTEAQIKQLVDYAVRNNPTHDMSLDSYQARAKATDLYPTDVRLVALLMGLANEAGEALGHYKKHLRGDEAYQDENTLKTALIKEIGDTLWYLSGIADALGETLSEVAQANLDKLASRYERGVIKKSGDDR